MLSGMNQTNHTPRPRARRTREEIRKFLRQFESSGLKAAGFCRAQGINYQVFLRWRRRHAEAPELREVPLGEVFGSPRWLMEIALANGSAVRFNGPVDARLFRGILQTLAR